MAQTLAISKAMTTMAQVQARFPIEYATGRSNFKIFSQLIPLTLFKKVIAPIDRIPANTTTSIGGYENSLSIYRLSN